MGNDGVMTVFRCLLVAALLVPVSLIAAEQSFDELPSGEAALKEAPDGDVFVIVFGENGVVLRFRDGQWKLSTARDIGGFGMLPSDDVGGVFVSRLGEEWAMDARSKRRGGGPFVDTGVKSIGEYRLELRCEDVYGNFWAARVDGEGRGVGLAVLPFGDPRRWQSVALPQNLAGDWKGFCSDDIGSVWLPTETAAVQINPRASDGGLRRFDAPDGARITTIARVANRQIVAGFADGSIRELKTHPTKAPEWRLVETLEGGPVRAMLHVSDGSLWAIAGDKIFRSGVLREPWQEHWIEQPRMPAGNHDNIFARIGDKLYTAGGKTFFGWPATDWVNLDHVWSYDVRSGIWAVETPMLEAGKAYPGIATLNDELWIVGGLFRAGKGTKATPSVEIYNPKTRRYRLGPKYPAARGQIVALTVGGRLFAVGGEDLPATGASDEMFSIGAGETEWRAEPPAPGPLLQAAGCVVDGKMVIASSARSECPGLFIYDPAARKWSSVAHPTGEPPSAPLVAALGDDVWVMGGRGKTDGVTAAYSYSMKTGKWTPGPDLPIPVSWGAAAEVNGRILIAGGAYREDRAGGIINSDRVFFLKGK